MHVHTTRRMAMNTTRTRTAAERCEESHWGGRSACKSMAHGDTSSGPLGHALESNVGDGLRNRRLGTARYQLPGDIATWPLCLVMKSTGIESVSTLTTRHAPLATRMRIAAHLRRACLARPGVAVPALSVRVAELGNNNANATSRTSDWGGSVRPGWSHPSK